jgi:hypothetical protein
MLIVDNLQNKAPGKTKIIRIPHKFAPNIQIIYKNLKFG